MSMKMSNPARTAKAQASAYTSSLLAQLGDKDPFEVQDALLPALRALTSGLEADALRQPEAAGKWSVLAVIHHLCDTELVYGWRMRQILTADKPKVQAYDQDAWAARLRYDEGEIRDLLDELGVLRKWNLRLLRSLDDKELDRVGLHSERGPESVRTICAMVAAHDLVHRRQIERIRKAIGK